MPLKHCLTHSRESRPLATSMECITVTTVNVRAMFRTPSKARLVFLDHQQSRDLKNWTLPPLLPHSHLAVGTVHKAHFVAYGSHGEVYRGTLSMKSQSGQLRNQVVAIKTLRRDKRLTEADILRKITREANISLPLKHENILSFKGIFTLETTNGQSPALYLASEWAYFGAADDYLDAHREDAPLIISGFAKGLEYLHSCEVGHMDLKPDNVFVTHGPRALIGDFGQALQGRTDGLAATHSGCFMYMSPEMAQCVDSDQIDARKALYEKADVYSFGLTSYEFMTGQRPFKSCKLPVVVWSLLTSRQNELLDHLPKYDPAVFSIPLFHLFESCWSVNSEHRPSMRDFRKSYRPLLNN